MYKLNLKKGFGLLEVLISAVIIILILSALVLVGRKALASNVYLQQRAQAIYKAQEGIELVRQMRDTNWIDGKNNTKWDTLVIDPNTGIYTNVTDLDISTPKNYLIQYTSPRRILLVPDTTSGAGEEIPFNSTAASDPIKMYRLVQIESVPAGVWPSANNGTDIHPEKNAIKVTVTVKWSLNPFWSSNPFETKEATDKSVSVSEILTNWRPNF